MRFGSRGPSEFFSQIRHRNALTEIAWEDAVQGLGGNVYRSVIEKQGIVAGIVVYPQPTSCPGLFPHPFIEEKALATRLIGNVFYKQWHLWVLFH